MMHLRPWRVLGPVLLLVVAGPALAHTPGWAAQDLGPVSGQDAPSPGAACQGGSGSPADCPNLVVDERSLWDAWVHKQTFGEDACAVEEGLVEPGTRRLLRFSFTTVNLGPGDLVLGDPAEHPDLFTMSDCEGHGHHHFDGFAAYRLWTPEGYRLWLSARALNPTAPAGEVLAGHPELGAHLVSGHKQGFCIMDVRPMAPVVMGAARYTCHRQGLSVGWGDTYGWHLDGQWVEITGVEDGYYVLEAEVNPQRTIEEASYADNAGATHVYVPPAWGEQGGAA